MNSPRSASLTVNQPGPNYRHKAFSGFSVQTMLKIISNVATILKLYFLARFLGPENMGVFSLVMIAIGLTESLTQTGVNITILQSKKPIQFFIDTAWVIAIIRGLLIGFVMLLLGVGMSRFYANPELFFLVALASLIPLVKGFINPAIILLHKELRFWSDGMYRLFLVLAETSLAILLVWQSHSVVALISSLILAAISEVIVSFVFFRDRPKFVFNLESAKHIFKNTNWLSINSVLNYLNENADNLLIGKLNGTRDLGLYQFGYSMSHEASYELAKSAHYGTLPIFFEIGHDVKRLRKAVVKTFLGTGVLLLGSSVGLVLAGPWLIPWLFGSEWLGMLPILPGLVLAGVLQAIMMLSLTVLFARKAHLVINFHALCSLGLMVGLIWWWGSLYGLSGAVAGLVVARLVTLPILGLALFKALQ